MPNEYEAASARPRRRETPAPAPEAPARPPAAPARTGSLAACPTMSDEMIGSIARTEGASDSSRPQMKRAPRIGQKPPPSGTAAIAPSSPPAAAVPPGDRLMLAERPALSAV